MVKTWVILGVGLVVARTSNEQCYVASEADGCLECSDAANGICKDNGAECTSQDECCLSRFTDEAEQLACVGVVGIVGCWFPVATGATCHLYGEVGGVAECRSTLFGCCTAMAERGAVGSLRECMDNQALDSQCACMALDPDDACGLTTTTTAPPASTAITTTTTTDAEPVTDCNRVVSNSDYENVACVRICRRLIAEDLAVEDDDEFRAHCYVQHYTEDQDGDFIPSDCFDTYVNGYYETDGTGLEGTTMSGTITPALCQTYCQLTDECIRFTWSPGETDLDNVCILKDTIQTHTAALTRFSEPEQDTDYYDEEYCPAAMREDCLSGAKECYTCEDQPTCIWKRPRTISGPRKCPKVALCTQKSFLMAFLAISARL